MADARRDAVLVQRDARYDGRGGAAQARLQKYVSGASEQVRRVRRQHTMSEHCRVRHEVGAGATIRHAGGHRAPGPRVRSALATLRILADRVQRASEWQGSRRRPLAGATGPESPLDACPAWCGVGGRAQMDPLGDVAHTVCAEGWRCCRGSFDVYAVVGVGPTHACLWFAHIASGTSDSYAIDKYYRG